jgi:hypothetical protein
MATKKKATAVGVTERRGGVKAAVGPQADEVAKLFGIELKEVPAGDEVHKLRKALPGYAAQLDDAAELLKGEPRLAQLFALSPQALLDTHAEQKALLAKESVAQQVYRSIYYQRLQLDDRGMELLQKIGRQVQFLGEDDPALLSRWKSLLDYLNTFRPGPRSKGKAAGSKPAGGEGDSEG